MDLVLQVLADKAHKEDGHDVGKDDSDQAACRCCTHVIRIVLSCENTR